MALSRHSHLSIRESPKDMSEFLDDCIRKMTKNLLWWGANGEENCVWQAMSQSRYSEERYDADDEGDGNGKLTRSNAERKALIRKYVVGCSLITQTNRVSN